MAGWVDDSGLERRRAEEEERLAGKFPAQVKKTSQIISQTVSQIFSQIFAGKFPHNLTNIHKYFNKYSQIFINIFTNICWQVSCSGEKLIIIICIVIMSKIITDIINFIIKITFSRELSRLGGDDRVLGVDLRAALRDRRYCKILRDPRYLKVLRNSCKVEKIPWFCC